MSFTANVPVSGQTLGNSRPIINSNFTVLQSTWDKNHQDFNLSNAGAHTHADLLAQSADPNPATTLISHYSKSVSGITEWFMQREAAGMTPGPVFQMSSGNPMQGAGSPTSNFGQTFLPGGFQMKWGLTAGAGGSQVVTYTGAGLTAFPSMTVNVQITPTGGPPGSNAVYSANNSSFSANGFTATYSPAIGTLFMWVAIGY